jgi:proliferating cell nuclear antigen
MEIVIRNQSRAEAFTAIFQHIKLFTEHITLICNQSGVYMQCMDNAHVAIVELNLPADWFDVYHLENSEDNIRMGMNSTFFHRILSSRDKDQQIQLLYSSKASDHLMIHLTCSTEIDAAVHPPPEQKKSKKGGKSKKSDAEDVVAVQESDTQLTAKIYFDKHFELPLIDIEDELMQIPEMEHTAELTMQSAQFANIIAQLKMFGDSMDVQCSEERIALASTSQENGKMYVEIGINDLSEFAIDEGADLSLSFSLTYLKNICAYNRISELVGIKFSDSYPMQVAYHLGGSDNARFMFHLAPKIDD